ncbi:MAG TPA: SLAC1 anion channel family protein [Candidatus Saccharibacteria bacterium]|nr:SLAC1 anion channel family protein [Candidatus Saccharibacteria bacterium]
MSKQTISSYYTRLVHLPLLAFGSVMGLTGLAIAIHSVARSWWTVDIISMVVAVIASLLFLLLLTLYSAKMFRYPDEIKAELQHPVRRNFIASIPISFLLQSIAYLTILPQLSWLLWVIGALLQLTTTIYIVGSWIWGSVSLSHITPTWYLPAVGNAVVPIAGVYHAPLDVSWWFFAIGAFLWIPVTTLLITRLLTGEKLPRFLGPTFFIMLAPPMVMSTALTQLDDALAVLSKIFFFIGAFVLVLLIANIRKIWGPTSLTAWSYVFPLATATVAATTVYGWMLGLPLLILTVSASGLAIRHTINTVLVETKNRDVIGLKYNDNKGLRNNLHNSSPS